MRLTWVLKLQTSRTLVELKYLSACQMCCPNLRIFEVVGIFCGIVTSNLKVENL